MLQKIKSIHKQAVINKGVLFLRTIKARDFERITQVWEGSINCKRIKGAVNIDTSNTIVNIKNVKDGIFGNLANVNLVQ